MSNVRALQKSATVKSWFERSVGWSLGLYGSWWLLSIIFQQLGPTERAESAAETVLLLCLLGAQAANWRLAVCGLSWALEQDEKAGFGLRGAATVWQALLSVFQILLLFQLLPLLLVSFIGMPLQD